MVDHVVVIGGGMAGIAAATRLSQENIAVTLIEKRPFLGGRTISVRHRETGEWIDNGQHVMMGCYHEFFKLLQRIGTHSCLHFQPTLEVDYHSTEGWHDHLRCPKLPGPYHLAAGLFWMKQVKFKEILQSKALQKAVEDIQPGETVAQLLERTGQSENMRKLMWDNIALSALNEPVETADARMFAEVLKQAFFGERDDSRLVVPIVGLQKMHEDAAMDYIYEHGGCVRTGHEINEIRMNRGSVNEVVLSNAEVIECDAVVSAVPAPAWQKLIWQSGLQNFAQTPEMGSSPILSVYLWFEKAFTNETISCAVGSHFEWIFHRTNFMHESEHKLNCVCLVASAAQHYFANSREDLVHKAIYDMNSLYPETQNIKVIASHVFWERHATFSCTPQNIEKRPPHQTHISNLFVAGDWTNTGLPATIEGAVLSGHNCAELILNSNQTDNHFVITRTHLFLVYRLGFIESINELENTMNLKDARILITGGSKGIGYATAKLLAENEAKVVITGRNAESIQAAAATINVIPITADINNPADRDRTIKTVQDQLGGLDVLVNNAGIGEFDTISDLSLEQFEKVFHTNVFSTALITQKAVEIFKSQDSGNIINIASTAATKGFERGTIYAASKFALRGMTQCWQAELRKHNIRVMEINPSEVTTAFRSKEGIERPEEPNKLRGAEIAHAIKAVLEMDDRGFIPELTVFATNPWG